MGNQGMDGGRPAWQPVVTGGTGDINPYAAPVAHVADAAVAGVPPLASRWARLGAVLVDWAVFAVPAILAAIALPALSPSGRASEGLATVLAMAFGFGILALMAWQLILLYRSGQTIGKKVLGIRIVRADGSRAGFARLLLLRYVVPGVIGAIPYLGVLFALVDALFIFGERKRCLHDHIADTVVVTA